MERKYDEQFKVVFEVLNKMLAEPDKSKTAIGYQAEAKGHKKKAKTKKKR